ncbi:MAG: hypothetical protein ACLUD2_14455 [Clostridium sp.]
MSGHGEETFLQRATGSTCNPVFIDVGQRLGVRPVLSVFEQFGLREKTGIDLPGEASLHHAQKRKHGAGGAGHSPLASFRLRPFS